MAIMVESNGGGSKFEVTNGKLLEEVSLKGKIPPYTFVQRSSTKTDHYVGYRELDGDVSDYRTTHKNNIGEHSFGNAIAVLRKASSGNVLDFYYVENDNVVFNKTEMVTAESIAELVGVDNYVYIFFKRTLLVYDISDAKNPRVITNNPLSYTFNFVGHLCVTPDKKYAYVANIESNKFYRLTLINGHKVDKSEEITGVETDNYNSMQLLAVSTNTFAIFAEVWSSNGMYVSAFYYLYTLTSGTTFRRVTSGTIDNTYGKDCYIYSIFYIRPGIVAMYCTIGYILYGLSENSIWKIWSATVDENDAGIIPLGENAFAKVKTNYNAAGYYLWYFEYFDVLQSGAVVSSGITSQHRIGDTISEILTVSSAVFCKGCSLVYARTKTKKYKYRIGYCQGPIVKNGIVPTKSELYGITSTEATTDKPGKYYVFDSTKPIPEEYINSVKTMAIQEVQNELNR